MSKQLKTALKYRKHGYRIVPMHTVEDGNCSCGENSCARVGKHPIVMGGVHAATNNAVRIRRWWKKWPNANIGIATGDHSDIIVLDIDPRNGGSETLANLEAELGPLPATARAVTGGGGQHLYFANPKFPVKSDTAGKLFGPGVDVLGNGSIAIAPYSRHISGKRYRHDQERNLLKGSTVLELPEAWQARLRLPPAKSIANQTISLLEGRQSKIAEGKRNDTLTSMGGHLVNTGLSDEAVAQCLMLVNQNRCDPQMTETEVRQIAESVLRYRPENANTVQNSREYLALAMLLAELFEGGKHLRYLPGHGYHIYDRTKWVLVETHAIEQLVLKVVEEQPADGSRKVMTVVADVMRLLQVKQNADPRTLYGDTIRPIINCLNGELWIGDDGQAQFRNHSPDSNLTHCLPVNYDPKAECPRYDKALRQIFCKSKNAADMARHWNELAGYLIQIHRDIPLIVLLLGMGANGKTELWTTLAALIGEEFVYSGSLDQIDKNRFLIGFLRGKLIFVDDDIKSGAKLPDGALKKISGGSLLTGELKGINSFQFINRALPILLCNNEPTTSDLSHGMERRIMVIPFKHRFRDGKDLDRTLWPAIRREELPGILNRYVRGLQRLRKRKSVFKLPADVARAKRVWFRNANPLKAYLHECTKRVTKGSVSLSALFDAYGLWATDNGISYRLQRNTMGRQLKQLGFNVRRRSSGTAVIGLVLKAKP